MREEADSGFSISDALLPLLDVALVLLGLFVVLFSLATLEPMGMSQTEMSQTEMSQAEMTIRPAREAQVAVLVFRGAERWGWRGHEALEVQGLDELRRTLGRFRDSLPEGPGVVMLVDEGAWTPEHDAQFLQTRRAVMEAGLRLGRAY